MTTASCSHSYSVAFGEPFAGSIDEVRVYNRALTAAEVAGLSGITEAIPAGL